MLAGVGKPDNHPVRIMFEIRVEGFGDGWPLGTLSSQLHGLICSEPLWVTERPSVPMPLQLHMGEAANSVCWVVRCNYSAIHPGSGKNRAGRDRRQNKSNN